MTDKTVSHAIERGIYFLFANRRFCGNEPRGRQPLDWWLSINLFTTKSMVCSNEASFESVKFMCRRRSREPTIVPSHRSHVKTSPNQKEDHRP